jgi:hypothetical protein
MLKSGREGIVGTNISSGITIAAVFNDANGSRAADLNEGRRESESIAGAHGQCVSMPIKAMQRVASDAMPHCQPVLDQSFRFLKRDDSQVS